MEPERLARYADKLDHAQQRLEAFESWKARPKGELKDRLASYKALQEAFEAMLDVVSMLVKDLGVPPRTTTPTSTRSRTEGSCPRARRRLSTR